ncbi:MAG: hypothetical protein U1E61_00700 [Bradyrhizobium sp.]
MIEKKLTNAQMEAVYDRLAEAVDSTPPESRMLMLTKLSLTLANMVGDTEQIGRAVGAAMANLTAPSPAP